MQVRRQRVNDKPNAVRAIGLLFEKYSTTSNLREPNEATTRLLLIDGVLEAMGWAREDFNPESASGTGGFLDYILSVDATPWMVVEAKRSGESFALPPASSRHHETLLRSMSSLLSRSGPIFRESAKQAADYCNDRGVPLACVTNGLQWVFFRGLSSKGRAWKDNATVVFQSSEEIRSHFDDFWHSLSRECAISSSLLRLLERTLSGDLPQSSRPTDYVTILRRSPDPADSAFVRSLGENIFGSLNRDGYGDMLQNCYIEPGTKGDFERSIAKLLKDTATIEAESLHHGDTDQFVEQVARTDQYGTTGAPILVVGHVGAGKTTFLHRSLLRLREETSAFFAIVDLEGEGSGGNINAAEEEAKVASKVLEKLSQVAKTILKNANHISPAARVEADADELTTLRTMYRGELEKERKFGSSLWELDAQAWARKEYELVQGFRAQPLKLLERFLRHLRNRFRQDGGSQYPILIMLDNVDQASDAFQRCMYGLAQRLASLTPALVILCIREDTYYRGLEPGGFLTSSSLQFVFHVGSPPLDRVIRERVRWAKKELSNSTAARLKHILREKARLLQVLDLVESSLLTQRSAATELLAGMAGNNVREALGFVRSMIAGAQLVRDVAQPTAAYALDCLVAVSSLAEMRATSRIANVFDAEPAETPSHSLRLRLLAYLSFAFDTQNGRVHAETTETIVARFGMWGYNIGDVENSLRYLLKLRLARPHDRSEAAPEHDWRELPHRITLTASGHVHVHRMANLPSYRLIMGMLSRWYDESLCSEFVKVCSEAGGDSGTSVADIELTGAAKLFDAYLAERWQLEENSLVVGLDRYDWIREVRSRMAGLFVTSAGPPILKPVSPQKDFIDRRVEVDEKQLSLSVTEVKVVRLEPISPDAKYKNTVWLPRILWALEWARRNERGPQTASDISRLLAEHCQFDVAATNIARAFRKFAEDEEVRILYVSSGKKYSISASGIKAIEYLLVKT